MLTRLSHHMRKNAMFSLFALALIAATILVGAFADPPVPDDGNSKASSNNTAETQQSSGSSPSDSPVLAVKGCQYRNAVAVYSREYIAHNWPKVQKRYEEVRAKADAAQKEIDAVGNRIKEKKKSYEKAKVTLSQKERGESETEIERLGSEYNSSLDKKQNEIDAETQAISKWFGSELSLASAVVAARLGCKTVQSERLPRTSGKTADSKDEPTFVDITALVLEELERPEWQCAPFPSPASASGQDAK